MYDPATASKLSTLVYSSISKQAFVYMCECVREEGAKLVDVMPW